MSDDFVFEDEDGNEFIFEDEEDVKTSSPSSSNTKFRSNSSFTKPSVHKTFSFDSTSSFSKSTNSPISSSNSSFDDDSSSEEWIFEEDSEEEVPNASLKRNATEPRIRRFKTNSDNFSQVPLKKFTSSLGKEDFTKTSNSDVKNKSWITGEDLIDLPEEPKVEKTPVKPPPSLVTPSTKTEIKKNPAIHSVVSNDRRTKRTASDNSVLKTHSKKSEKIDKKKEEEENDIADQITALRVIASKGKDTKYLSIRGAPAPPPPKSTSPFCGAVSSDPRTNIVSEIVTTEEGYVNDIETLIKLYYEPLKTRKTKKKKLIITKEQLKDLFSNIESILNLNRVLLSDLQIQASLPVEKQRIGSSFNLIAKCLLIYTDYCSNQKKADDLYTKLKNSNNEFNALLAEGIAKPESRNLDLNSFLIKPVQRACKYPLLLKELLKHTPETHEDYGDLKLAYEAMQESCLKLNERKRDVENMSHFLTIKARTGKNFIETGRTFVEDGNIKMITEKPNKRSGKVRFRLRKGRYVLFSDMVVFISEGKVIAQISLSTAQLKEPQLAAHPLAILLVARASRLILLPNSQFEKDSMIKLINGQIEELAKRKSSRDRVTPKPRMGRKQSTTSIPYHCVLNNEQEKTIPIPSSCIHITDLKRRIRGAYSLPNSNFKLSFETNDGKLLDINSNQEYGQYIPFMKKVHITA